MEGSGPHRTGGQVYLGGRLVSLNSSLVGRTCSEIRHDGVT